MTSELNKPEEVLGSHMSPIMEEPANTMPLLGGMVRPDGLPAPGEELSDITGVSGSTFGRGTLVLLLVFSIAAGSIYLMKQSQPDIVSSEEVSPVELRVEEALTRLAATSSTSGTQLISDEASDGTETIVSMFSTDPAGQQVPLEYLQKNPFVMPDIEQPQSSQAENTTKNTKQDRDRDILAKLKQEVGRYNLQTVMQGKFPLAIIDGQIVKKGQKLGSFTLIAITDRAVKLSNGKYQFTLRMDK